MRNNWLLFFIYLVVLSCYFIFTDKILASLDKQAGTTFNILPLMIVSMLLFIGLGLLIGLEQYRFERRKEGNWGINLPKLILLGLPLLYFSIGALVTYFPISFISKILFNPILYFLKSRVDFAPIFQLLLGYTLITSFVKVKKLYIFHC